MIIPAVGHEHTLFVTLPHTLPMARITSQRAHANVFVNRPHNECPTTYIWSLLIQYVLLNSSTNVSNNA